jgi:hypothetical protein
VRDRPPPARCGRSPTPALTRGGRCSTAARRMGIPRKLPSFRRCMSPVTIRFARASTAQASTRPSSGSSGTSPISVRTSTNSATRRRSATMARWSSGEKPSFG